MSDIEEDVQQYDEDFEASSLKKSSEKKQNQKMEESSFDWLKDSLIKESKDEEIAKKLVLHKSEVSPQLNKISDNENINNFASQQQQLPQQPRKSSQDKNLQSININQLESQIIKSDEQQPPPESLQSGQLQSKITKKPSQEGSSGNLGEEQKQDKSPMGQSSSNQNSRLGKKSVANPFGSKKSIERDPSPQSAAALISSKPDYQMQQSQISQGEALQQGSLGGSQFSQQMYDVDKEVQDRLDLENVYIFLKQLVKTKRLEVLECLQQKEQNVVVIVKPRSSMAEEKLEQLRKKRRACWRGYIRLNDLNDVLKDFEFTKCTMQCVLKFLITNNCYNKKNDFANFSKMLATFNMKKSNVSFLNNKFTPYVKLREFRLKEDAVTYIAEHYREYRRIQKIKEEKAKLEELQLKKKPDEPTEEEKLVQKMNQSADQLIKILREKVGQTDAQLGTVFLTFDKNRDGYISEEEFVIAFQQSGIQLEERVLRQAYAKFDLNKDQKVSQMEFLALMYGKDDPRSQLMRYLVKIEDLVEDMRLHFRHRFDSLRGFISKVTAENKQEITEEDLRRTITGITQRYSGIQIHDVFCHLNKSGNDFITLDDVKELYEHQVQKGPMNLEAIEQKKQADEERKIKRQKELEEQAAESIDSMIKKHEEQKDQKKIKELWADSQRSESVQEYKSLQDQKMVEIFTGPEGSRKMDERRKKELQDMYKLYRDQIQDMEKVLMMISEKVLEKLKQQGKSLRELFSIFTGEGTKATVGYIDIEGFLNMMKLILGNSIPDSYSKAIFNIFCNDLTRRLSFSLFNNLIQAGSKIHPLYLKLKFRFGAKFDQKKDKMIEDLQLADAREGSGFVRISDFKSNFKMQQEINFLFKKKEIFELNGIEVSDADVDRLKNDGMLKTQDGQIMLNYQRVAKLIFPQNLQLKQEVLKKSIRLISRFAYIWKQVKMRREKEQQLQASQGKKKGGKGVGKGKAGQPTTPKQQLKSSQIASSQVKLKKDLEQIEEVEEKNELQQIGEALKNKDLYEMGQQEAPPEQDTAKGKKGGKLGSKKRGQPLKQSLNDQLSKVLPAVEHDGDFLKEKSKKSYQFCQIIVEDCMNRSFAFGESLMLSKQIQYKFEMRPVIKEVHVVLKDFAIDVLDTLPKSIYTSGQTGRLLYMDRQSMMHQYDLSNSKKLKDISLGSKVPLKRSRILDSAFDHKSGRFYLLNDHWILEVWELVQNTSIPVARIRIFTAEMDTQNVVERCYPRRFCNAFPHFLVLSTAMHAMLLVNCTCINNSIVFVDPISLSVFSTVFLSPSDFKMSSNISLLMNYIMPKLTELQQADIGFLKLFEGRIKMLQEGPSVHVQDFTEMLYKVFGQQNSNPEAQAVTSEQWAEISEFLDQNNSGFLSQSEYEFLYELRKYVSVKQQSEGNIAKLQKVSGLSEGAIKLLQKLSEYLDQMKLSVEDAFSVFDRDGSGHISYKEFEQILERVCGKSRVAQTEMEELALFMDKDKNHCIEIEEFAEVFGAATDLSLRQQLTLGARNNLMMCFQRAFAGGIDVEQLLLARDPNLEGQIKATEFRRILKWLPLGLTEDEIEHIMRSQVPYNDIGNVNYVNFCNNMQFKEMKFSYKLKKSMVRPEEVDKFHEGVDKDKREGILQNQKVLLESLIYLDDFDIIIYTTICPRTSLIFVSQTKKAASLYDEAAKSKQQPTPAPTAGNSHNASFVGGWQQHSQQKNEQSQSSKKVDSDVFKLRLLAKLDGHITSNPPTIYYVKESGCLVSGEKLNSTMQTSSGGGGGVDGGGGQSSKQTSKLPQKQPPGSGKADQPNFMRATGNESFSNFYSNIDVIKQQSANIIIWNLQKDLCALYDTNPPWNIQPARVIEAAHHDSILDIVYLPYSQILATCSCDKTIKLWNPIGRPYSMIMAQDQGTVQVKPGYYICSEQEYSFSNQPFSMIKTIYTGTGTCYSLKPFLQRVPVQTVQSEAGPKKYYAIEVMLSLNLEKPQIIANSYKSPGVITGYSIDKMRLEVPCNQHDEVVPKKYQDEMTELAVDKRKKAYINYQLQLPQILETLQARMKVQETSLKHVLELLKAITLHKFDESTDRQRHEEEQQQAAQELFSALINLPSQQAFQDFVGDVAGRTHLTANQLFYYLKQFHALHPLNTTRDQFFAVVQVLKVRSKQGLLVQGTQGCNQLEKSLRQLFKSCNVDLRSLFQKQLSAMIEESKQEQGSLRQPDIVIVREDFKKLLQQGGEQEEYKSGLGVYTREEDFIQFMVLIDPLFTNLVSCNKVEDFFSSEIIEQRLARITRPQELIMNTMSKLGARQRVQLMFSLQQADIKCEGHLLKNQFLGAFEVSAAGLVDKSVLEELFEMLSHKFSSEETDEVKVISLKVIQKKFFSANENIGMARHYHTLSKIRALLLEKGLKADYPFKEQSGAGKATVMMRASVTAFVERILDLKSSNISEKALQQLAQFLSVCSEKSETPFISLQTFQHYLRKLHTKDKYLLLTEYKLMHNEVRAVLEQEEQFLTISRKFHHSRGKAPIQLNLAELRSVLNNLHVSHDLVDELIVRFAQDDQQAQLTAEQFLQRLKDFVAQFEGLQLQQSMLQSIQAVENEDVQQKSQLQDNEDKQQDPQLQLSDLLFNKSVKVQKQLFIKDNKYTQELVQFVRQKAPFDIINLLKICESVDSMRQGTLDLSIFANVFRQNVSGITEEMLINFQNEYCTYHEGNSHIDYAQFFETYFLESGLEEAINKPYVASMEKEIEKVDMNALFQRVSSTLAQSNVNMSSALKFFESRQQQATGGDAGGRLAVSDLEQLLGWGKCELSEVEKKALVYALQPAQDDTVSLTEFQNRIYVAQQRVATTFNEQTWMLTSKDIQQKTLINIQNNMEFFRFLVKQKQKEFTEGLRKQQRQSRASSSGISFKSQSQTSSEEFKIQISQMQMQYPLVSATAFANSVQELKADFSLKESDQLTTFAIVGCAVNPEEGYTKYAKLSRDGDIQLEVINMNLFESAVPKVIDLLRKEKEQTVREMALQSKRSINEEAKLQQQYQFTDDERFLLAKINGQMRDRNVSMWDALLSTNFSITSETQVPVREFKYLLNSLDLTLTLKEKLQLIRMADPQASGRCDIQLFVNKVEADALMSGHGKKKGLSAIGKSSTGGISERGVNLILEKFATTLFYNDMSLKRVFECFDIDKDHTISKNEFIYGMNQLQLGLTIFEIQQIMNLIDFDGSGSISQDEFISCFNKFNQNYEIDPLKDFSLNLLTKIKNLITFKGADLLQTFIEFDTANAGIVTFEELKTCLKRFGLSNVRNYQIATMIKIYRGEYNAVSSGSVGGVGGAGGSQVLQQSQSMGISGASPAKKQANYSYSGLSSAKPKTNVKQEFFPTTTTSAPSINNPQQQLLEQDPMQDVEEMKNEKLNYRVFTKKLLDAVEQHGRSHMEAANDLIRKVSKILKVKHVSLFECFVYFDVNQTNSVSKLEMNMGLQNLDLNLGEMEFAMLWKSFEKTKNNKLAFPAFVNRFLQAGALQIINFDDSLQTVLKKFNTYLKKYGDYMDAYDKMDRNQNGFISLFEFKEACRRLQFNLKNEEVNLLFKAFTNVDNGGLDLKELQPTTEDKMQLSLQQSALLQQSRLQEQMEQQQQSSSTFTYRQFMHVMSQFTNKTLCDQALYKIAKRSQDKKINWKDTIAEFLLSNAAQKKSATSTEGQTLTTKGSTQQQQQSKDLMTLQQLKTLVKQLKLGLSNEELENLANAFDSSHVNHVILEKKLERAVLKLDDSQRERSMLVHGLVMRIQEVLLKEKIQPARVFFDFDENQSGSLTLSEFTKLLYFLQISANKTQTKLLFEAIDIDKKAYITLPEFQNFLHESVFVRQALEGGGTSSGGNQMSDEQNQGGDEAGRAEAARLEELCRIIKTQLAERKTTLQKVLHECQMQENQAVNSKLLEKLLLAIGVVLKQGDLAFLLRKIGSAGNSNGGNAVDGSAGDDQRNSTTTGHFVNFQNFLDFAIRQHIEAITYDENVNYIHPTVAMGVDKMAQLFRRLEIDSRCAFRYFMKQKRSGSVTRKEALRLLQVLDMNFSSDDLILIYNYFDDKRYGEVTEEQFVEKFDVIASSSLNKLKQSNEADIVGANSAAQQGPGEEQQPSAQQQKLQKLSNRQQVQTIMQKVYYFMQGKRYSRRQMRALFDSNGNGLLSREEFIEAFQCIHIEVPLDKLRMLIDFIDRNDSGQVEVDEFLNAVFEAVPQETQNQLGDGQLHKIFLEVVSRLKKETYSLLEQMVEMEKNVLSQSVEKKSGAGKRRAGIAINDFYKIARRFNLALSEEEKEVVKKAFALKVNQEFLDLEAMYDFIDNMYYQKQAETRAAQVMLDADSSGLTALWEQNVYRQIGDYLRRNNLTVEMAFRNIDRDNTGMISAEEFRKFIDSLQLSNISEKEKLLLISNYTENSQDKGGVISITAFKNKFWEAYTCFGRENNATAKMQAKGQVDELQSAKRQVLTYMFMTLRERTDNNRERAWALLDQRKIGYFEIADLRSSLVQLSVYLSKSELSFIFNFMDKDKNNIVNCFEFFDFWEIGQEHLVGGGGDAQLQLTSGSLNEVARLEEQVLEHLCKVVNQREISIWDAFAEIDKDRVGFLMPAAFTQFLQMIGVTTLDESRVTQLMRIIDPKAYGERVHLSAVETRLRKYGLTVQQTSTVEHVEWKDKPLFKFALALGGHLKSEKTPVEYFSQFDQDYDGFLTPMEFFQAFKYVGADAGLQDHQITRLAQRLVSTKTYTPRINIADLDQFINKLMLEVEATVVQQKQQIKNNNSSSGEDENPCQNLITLDLSVFSSVLAHYDGFKNMFSSVANLHSSTVQLARYIDNRRDRLRGLRIASKQASLLQLMQQFNALDTSLYAALSSLRKASVAFIHNVVSVTALDAKFNALTQVDQELLRLADYEMDQIQINQIADNSVFTIDEDSLLYCTPWFKNYQGALTRSPDRRLDIFVYPRETLARISQDGVAFEKHLALELKVHNVLMRKIPQCSGSGGLRSSSGIDSPGLIFRNAAIYEKRIGIEASDKELYVINEAVDQQNYKQLSMLISENGGLLRIPFLTKTNAVTTIVKFWGAQLLRIISEVNRLGCVLTILRPQNIYISKNGQNLILGNVRGVARYNQFARVSQCPDLEVNLIQEVGPLSAKLGQNFADLDKAAYQDLLRSQPYLSPEQIFKNSLELTPYIDIWAFGCILYELLFGIPPPSYLLSLKQSGTLSDDDLQRHFSGGNKSQEKQPSDFYHYNLFPDNLIKDIIQNDYNEISAGIEFGPAQQSMIKAISKKSFGGMFDSIFQEFEGKQPLGFEELGRILDIVSLCLEYDPYRRPTVEALLASPLFSQDPYESINARDFSQCMFFYKSPSLAVRDKVFSPLRRLSAISMRNPLELLQYTEDIINITDLLIDVCVPQTSKQLDDLQKNLSLNEKQQQSEHQRSGRRGLPMVMLKKLGDQEKIRRKLSNYTMLKFIFDNDVLDLLVFVVLRHHKQMSIKEDNLTRNTPIETVSTNKEIFDATRTNTLRVLQCTKKLFQVLVYQLTDYASAAAPYVNKIIENLVKFFLGEEYRLTSDMVDMLNSSAGQIPLRNSLDEYKSASSSGHRRGFEKFFERNINSAERDEADELWADKGLPRPYVYQSRNWTPVLYSVLGVLFKETISEAGVGKGTYPVVQDFIRFSTERYAINEYDVNNKVKRLNEQIQRTLPRTADYYNDLISMAENLNIIYYNEKVLQSISSLRIVLSYFKSMLKGNNTDKIRLILDSRAPVYLIPYLNTDNVHVRGEILDIFYEISRGFAETPFSYIRSRADASTSNTSNLKKTEEINKNFGIVAHINLVTEDKIDRHRFLDSANEYYYLRKQINKVYLYQLSFIFESPIVISNIFATLRTKAELQQSKIVILRIFQCLVNAPPSIIRLMNQATMDVFTSIFRVLIKPKPGVPSSESKQNKILAPIVIDVYRQIQQQAREEIIEILEQNQKIRAMLREEALEIPDKLNLHTLSMQFDALDRSYQAERGRIQLEIKGKILSRTLTAHFKDICPATDQFYTVMHQILQHTLSWFKFYICKLDGVLTEAKKFVDQIMALCIMVFNDLFPYAQINEQAEQILTEITDFIEILINMDLEFLVFSQSDMKLAVKHSTWMIEQVNRIYTYHDDIERDAHEVDADDRQRKKAFESLQDGSEAKEEAIFKYILDHDVLRKHSLNKLIRIAHAFLRILMRLTEGQFNCYHELLLQINFGQFFIHFIKNQYQLLAAYIKTKTEKIHVITNYVEETNFRVKTFENILQGNNQELKSQLVQQGFISQICGNYLTNEAEFQVSDNVTPQQFLPFSYFLPFRNEALAMATAIIWHREGSPQIYKELLLQISHYNLIKREYENLRKHNNKSMVFLSAMYFFSLLVNANDSQLTFLMKHEKVNDFLSEFFTKNSEFKNYFPQLFNSMNPTNLFSIQ